MACCTIICIIRWLTFVLTLIWSQPCRDWQLLLQDSRAYSGLLVNSWYESMHWTAGQVEGQNPQKQAEVEKQWIARHPAGCGWRHRQHACLNCLAQVNMTKKNLWMSWTNQQTRNVPHASHNLRMLVPTTTDPKRSWSCTLTTFAIANWSKNSASATKYTFPVVQLPTMQKEHTVSF